MTFLPWSRSCLEQSTFFKNLNLYSDADNPRKIDLHVPLDRYMSNLRSIALEILDLGVSRLIFITPPPTRKGAYPDSRFAYRNAMISVARELDLVLMDTWALFFNKTSGLATDAVLDSITMNDYNDTLLSDYLVDHEHYNRKGNDLHWSGLRNLILKVYPEMNPWEKCY